MKTKVQAQRKFAQGAVIPPTLNITNVSIDRRIDVSPNKEKNIFHNRTSAKSLLDIVSFKNLHKHAQPIVLLERLENQHTLGSKDHSSSPLTNASKPNTGTINKSNHEPKQASDNARVATIRQQRNSKTSIITPSPPMRLRSRILNSNGSNKAYKKKNSIKDRKRVIASARKRKIKKRPQRVVDEFSNDDDQPLTFFRKKTLRVRRHKMVKQKKLKNPKSVKYSEPLCSFKEKIVRRILDVPDVITEIPESILNYVTDMDLTESDVCSETSDAEYPTSQLDQNPIPETDVYNKDIYEDPVPSTSAASIYDDPVPSTSAPLIYEDSLPGTPSFVEPVPNTSTTSVYQDPVPGTSSCQHQVPMPENESIKPNYPVPVFGPSNEFETIIFKKPPFYGRRAIENWILSDMPFVAPLPHVSTRKSSRNRNDQNLNTEIDLEICIGSKLSSMAAILKYGPSFYDCLCLNCEHCKNIHELLNQHKTNSLEILMEQDLKGITESDANMNNNQTFPNIIIRDIRTEESGRVFITIGDDNDKDTKTIDLTEDSNDVNFVRDLPHSDSSQNVVRQEIQVTNAVQNEILAENVVQHKLPVQNVVQHEIPVQNVNQQEMPLQNVVQHEMLEQNVAQVVTPEQNGAQDEMPVQNVVQHEVPDQNIAQDNMPEQNDVQHEISAQDVDQQAAPGRKRTPPVRGRKRGRNRPVCGPITRQKTQAAANAKVKRKKKNKEVIDPTLPKILQGADLINAPVFFPKPEEFLDPMEYLESVMPAAAQFGLFKVVAPAGFQPPCTMGDNARFTVTNQYIARLFSRWGPAAREMCTIRAYLASQKVFFSRAPLLDGLEVNLPKLFNTVQKLGGLKSVFNKKKWIRVAEELKIKTIPNPAKKFDLLCLKYLLPYDTLTKRERQAIMTHVEQEWGKKSAKMLTRVLNPLHQQKRLLGDSDSSDDDQDEDDVYVQALSESEDCVVRGRKMCLGTFKKIADTALKMYFSPGDPPPTAAAVEDEYWKIVLLGTDHVSINAAFIDTGPEGYGFTKNKNAPYGKHPWNLKMLSSNKRNILRYLGLVSGVTIPSLHVGMVFSTSCWHRDPHGLPWIEYMHQGPDKIWYGVPEGQSSNFRIAAETLCPTSCQKKPIWLSSDIAMIPPNLLLEQNVRLSRLVQKPGEFIVVMPGAYSCSISTGFTISESVYFATNSFLQNVYPVFQELRESCEPSTFSLEQLLISMSKDPRTPRYLQQQVHGYLNTIVSQELVYRNALTELKVPLQHVKRRVASWNLRDEEECQVCRTALYLSRVTGVIGKKSKLCQQHALRVLNDRKEDGKLDLTGIVLEVAMTRDELDEIIRNLQKQLLSSQ